MEEISGTKSHKLILNNRRTGSFTGILDVLSFDVLVDALPGNPNSTDQLKDWLLSLGYVWDIILTEKKPKMFWLKSKPLDLMMHLSPLKY